MSETRVHDLYRYPLKGARGLRVEELVIDPKVGIPNDRRYAIRRTEDSLDEWSTKSNFYVCMNTPSMALEIPAFTDAEANDAPLKSEYIQHLGQRLGVQGDVRVQNTGGNYNLCDTKGVSVSFLNLASVRELSTFMGTEVDPRRFRMNIWIDGMDPFAELEYVDKYPGTREILISDIRFRVDDACERCMATHANPETGQRDLDILKALDELLHSRGYAGSPHRGVFRVMGILAVPLCSGTIVLGDTFKPVA